MIKKRRLPFHAVVALRTMRDVSLGELLAVDVFVAIFALRGRALEIHVQEPGFEIRRLMTVDARRRPVRSQQRELCLRMIKP